MSINTSSRCNNQHLNVARRCLRNKNRDKLTKKHYLLIGIQNKKMYLCMVKSRYLPRLLYKNIIEYLKVKIYGLRNWKRLYRMRYMYRWVPSRRHLWRRHLFYWSRSLHRVRNLCRGMPKWGYLPSGVKIWNERKLRPGDVWKMNRNEDWNAHRVWWYKRLFCVSKQPLIIWCLLYYVCIMNKLMLDAYQITFICCQTYKGNLYCQRRKYWMITMNK